LTAESWLRHVTVTLMTFDQAVERSNVRRIVVVTIALRTNCPESWLRNVVKF